jgi:uncharacterized protein DUF6438
VFGKLPNTAGWQPALPEDFRLAAHSGFSYCRRMRLSHVVVAIALMPVHVQAGEKREPEITRIVLERTACFGACPVYRLTVDRSRKVVFEGKAHVWEVGRQTGRVSKEGFRQLVSKIEEINFFSLKDRYDGKNADGSGSTVTDLPTRKTSVTRGNVTKTVENYFRGPKGLKELEDLIDEVTNSTEWVRG